MTLDKIRIEQNNITKECNRKLFNVNILEQMLHGMVDNPTPSRSDIFDNRLRAIGFVRNAIDIKEATESDISDIIPLMDEMAEAFVELEKAKKLPIEPGRVLEVTPASRATVRFGNARAKLTRRLSELKVENSIRTVSCLMSDPDFEDQIKALLGLRLIGR